MTDWAAMRAAVAMRASPVRVFEARTGALPTGIVVLLRVAAGDHAIEADAARELARPVEEIRASALFFVENILLATESDSYRALGGTPRSDAIELRRNMALLLRALHPDLHGGMEQTRLTLRVTEAWNKIKTPALRDRYERERLATSRRRPTPIASRKSSRRRPSRPPRKSLLVDGLAWVLATLFGQGALRRSPRRR